MIGVDKLTVGPTDFIGLQTGPVQFSPILRTAHCKTQNYVILFIKLDNAHPMYIIAQLFVYCYMFRRNSVIFMQSIHGYLKPFH